VKRKQKRNSVYGLVLLLLSTALYATTTYPYAQQIKTAAQRYGVEEALVRAVIKSESNFDAHARSHKGALGLMQLMPTTARQYEPQIARFQLQEEPALNIAIGTRHLKTLEHQVAKRYPKVQGLDRVRLIAAAYNAGWGRVVSAGGTIPSIRETQTYVRRVSRYYQRYGGRLKPQTATGFIETAPVEAIAHVVPVFNAAVESAKVGATLALMFAAYGLTAWIHLILVRWHFASAS
jgi:soluble lytic murein transglycosylase-like protein